MIILHNYFSMRHELADVSLNNRTAHKNTTVSPAHKQIIILLHKAKRKYRATSLEDNSRQSRDRDIMHHAK
jgi:hypothetical protein